MKLNYRDKVLLGILLAVVIIVAGIFALIRPKTKEIKENRVILAEKLKEREEIEKKIAEIKPLQEDIKKIRTETNELVADFMDSETIFDARKVDKLMQHFAVENEVVITTLNATDIGTGSMPYYYFETMFPGEDILAKADLKGDIIKDHAKTNEAATSLKARTKETVLQAQYSITVQGEKENIWNYMKALEEQKETMLINSVTLTNIELKEDKNNPKTDEEKENNKPGAQFIITLYSLYELTEPKLD